MCLSFRTIILWFKNKIFFFLFLWKRNNRDIIQFSRLYHQRFICKILASITFFSLNYSKCIQSKLSNKHIGRSISLRLPIKYLFFFLPFFTLCMSALGERGWKRDVKSCSLIHTNTDNFTGTNKKMYKKKLFKANKWF